MFKSDSGHFAVQQPNSVLQVPSCVHRDPCPSSVADRTAPPTLALSEPGMGQERGGNLVLCITYFCYICLFSLTSKIHQVYTFLSHTYSLSGNKAPQTQQLRYAMLLSYSSRVQKPKMRFRALKPRFGQSCVSFCRLKENLFLWFSNFKVPLLSFVPFLSIFKASTCRFNPSHITSHQPRPSASLVF